MKPKVLPAAAAAAAAARDPGKDEAFVALTESLFEDFEGCRP